MKNHYKQLLKNIFLDRELLFAALAIVLIYPFLYVVQFKTQMDLKFIPLLVSYSYLGCLGLSIPFKLIIK